MVLLLAGHAELGGLAADGDDDRVSTQLGPVLQLDDLAVAVAANLLHRLVGLDLETEFESMLGHLLREVSAGDRREAGIVLDELGVEDLAAEILLLQKDRFHARAGCVQPGGEAGRTAADDDEIEVRHRDPFAEALPD